VAAGRVNVTEDREGRTVGQIIRANALTPFNGILGTLFVVVLITGRFPDALFGFVLLLNFVIGVGQEVRAKRTLDRLALLHMPTCRVVRAEGTGDLPVDQVVVDDLVALGTGDQVPVDGTLLSVDGMEVDESLLTGESDPVGKQLGDDVLSGSFVVAGGGLVRATAVGDDAYARRLATEAKRFDLTRSRLRQAINRLLRVIMWVILVMAPLVVWSQLRVEDDWRLALSRSVAALGSMIPEGLVLLTSLTMAVGAVALARRNVLVQELSAVEGLARVDVVCLDKTGTLTDGQVRMERLELLDGTSPDARTALAALAALPNANATMRAIAAESPPPDGDGGWQPTDTVPFSSARKWSAATFDGRGTWVLGAPEIVGVHASDLQLTARTDELVREGKRVLLLAHADGPASAEALPDDLRPAGLCILSEQVRPDAPDILQYFADQGVTVKLISGDNPRAVTALARRAGLEVGEPVDARSLPDDDEELADLVEQRQVFGRVVPDQKRRLVRALQARGHTVAMTGDGVNDVLALKDSDLGVAMGSGSSATRAVAQLVLLDNRFAMLPRVVAEGRRLINNIERVANLYLTRNVYSFVIALSVALIGTSFLFVPRQFTLIAATTYGIPSFFLALAPFEGRHKPGFLQRVLGFSLPTGAFMGAAILATWGVLSHVIDHSPTEARSGAVIAAIVAGLGVLTLIARPLRLWKVGLVAAMGLIATAVLAWPRATELLEMEVTAPAIVVAAVAGLAAVALAWAADRWLDVKRLLPRWS
jgi:cation-transporting ATPase E